MGGFLTNLALHIIPGAMLGWLSAEVFLRNPLHRLNRLASILFALMALQFGASFLASFFPEADAAKLVNGLLIVPTCVLGFLMMLFVRQLGGQTGKPPASYLDIALVVPFVLIVLVVSQPNVYGAYAKYTVALNPGEGVRAGSIILAATVWLYASAVWLIGWKTARNAADSTGSQHIQAGLGIFAGAVVTLTAMVAGLSGFSAAYANLIGLYAMLLFAFFIRRAILYYGLMPSVMEKYRVLFELSPFGVLLLDADGSIREANPVVKLLLGLPPAELIGKPVSMFLDRGERLPLGGVGSAMLEVGMIDIAGVSRRMTVHLSEVTAEGERMYCVVLQDETGRKKAEEEIWYLAYHDALTGVGNRLYFQETISSLLQNGTEGALLLLDLDRFKAVNDRHGHQAGDALLREIAFKLRECTPLSGMLFRLGGDEFAVVLPDVGGTWEPAATAENLLAGLTGHRGAIAPESPVTVSIGIAQWPAHGSDTTALLHAADVAMYKSKEQGRNRYSMYVQAYAGAGA
ncbi:PAS domain S-box-containing protein/diguanylate cyclase (GGDEF) domain-containing protein [Cohnella sp. OV330]|uniref:diguanylate cyclase domain-containing protein n=1 Tax=Cohnella sp. OV330 TaxID=1855288 RepID=UPI0008ED3B59|nr:diguanylate cyclase [Cohnella sp. OV330]SFA93880.1 PAS domain S-box-containing protein/diguanylate cyclase (GGDEF) domain-containing protein [Cohnella sp. OV330]